MLGPRDTGRCAACGAPIDGPALGDPGCGPSFHAACAAQRLPGDAVVALVAGLALLAVPVAVVWAG